MLDKPILARCDDRTRQARTHPDREPEKWLADPHLASHDLVGLTFDFFVNWNTGSIPNQLWIKRTVKKSFAPWPIPRWGNILPGAIYRCDGEQKVKNLCEFAGTHGMSCHYFLFKDSTDSRRPPASIIEVMFDENGSIIRVPKVELSGLIERIQQLRGGPFRSGEPLNYASTSLECYLYNNTRAPWPGDADLILVNANFDPITIIEFKKHTSYSRIPFDDQKLSNYYSDNDPYKYDSFAYLRDRFTDDPNRLPIIVLYYSVMPFVDKVMLERIEGEVGSLTATPPVPVPLPKASDEGSCRDFVESLLRMINYET